VIRGDRRQHGATVQALREWIALPSIAAENRSYPQGAEYMARLARDAGFGRIDVIPTAGKPGVFATLDAGAATTLALYFMYDVKQFDASEWSSPPLEGRIVDRPGVGKIMVGRGATNTKGPQIALLAALRAFKAAGRKLPVNLVLVCEGEEEIGSPNFSEIVFSRRSKRRSASASASSFRSATRSSTGRCRSISESKGIVELESCHRERSGDAGRPRMSIRATKRSSTALRGIWCRRSIPWSRPTAILPPSKASSTRCVRSARSSRRFLDQAIPRRDEAAARER